MHPSPQNRRRTWVDLRGQWGFAFDDGDIGRIRGWAIDARPFDRQINVPFPPESRLSGIADPAPHPVLWYRRAFRYERTGPDYRVLLRFGAVDYRADVWINGIFVGLHQGGNTSFALDVTEALAEGGEQVVVVRAEDSASDLAQPRGKQAWEPEPSRVWYHRTSGIWQPVWLETVPATHVEEIRWLPSTGSQLELTVRLNREPTDGHRIRVRLSRSGTIVTEDLYRPAGREIRRRIHLEYAVLEIGRSRLLWEPSHPNLIETVVILEDETGRILDEVCGYVGMRTVGFEDGLFLLNERPLYARLVLAQNYWPESHLAAPSDEAIRREVEWVKRLGFNGVRIHQKVEDPRFLYWCDRLGVLVVSEMASFYVFSDVAVERFVGEWLEAVRRDFNHPSIVWWLPFNESWGVLDIANDLAQQNLVRSVYHLTKALDPSRLASGNDGWEYLIGDIVGIHDYATSGATLRERYGTAEALDQSLARVRPHDRRPLLPGHGRLSEPVLLTEFGGIAYDPQPGKPWFGYGTVRDGPEFLARYEDLMGAVLDSSVLAGFCYTQLTDTAQEANGLLTADRQPKVDIDELARITRQPSRALPGEATVLSYAAALSVVEREKP